MSSQVERSTCKECAHFKICKYTEDYEEAGRQACHLDIKEPFKIVIACPYYSWVGSPGVTFRDVVAQQKTEE